MAETASPAAASSDPKELQVPLSRVILFVRQLSHDLRNHLNAAELQAAYLKEIAEGEEIKAEIQRLRGMVSEIGGSLQGLTSSLSPVKLTLMPYEASAFVEDLQQKATQQFASETDAFRWEIQPIDAMLEIDPQLLQHALLQLLDNALRHTRGTGPILITAEAAGRKLSLELREPKSAFEGSTGDWGREPLKFAKHGHYSLGLHRARNIIEAHGGTLAAQHDPSSSLLVSTISLPISDGQP